MTKEIPVKARWKNGIVVVAESSMVTGYGTHLKPGQCHKTEIEAVQHLRKYLDQTARGLDKQLLRVREERETVDRYFVALMVTAEE